MTLEELYKDLHSRPELAFAEHRTAGIAAEWLAGAGYTVTTGAGGTGMAGVLRNRDGPAVLVRADMDALPLREETGPDYASDVVAADARGERTHVMHACGHERNSRTPSVTSRSGWASSQPRPQPGRLASERCCSRMPRMASMPGVMGTRSLLSGVIQPGRWPSGMKAPLTRNGRASRFR